MNKPKIRRILFATDFIENSQLDLDCAAAFAHDFCFGEKHLRSGSYLSLRNHTGSLQWSDL